jgi:hypothetical protein
MTSMHSSGPIVGSPLDGVSPALAGTLETISVVASERSFAYALLEAIEVMHNQPDLATLLSVVADFGTTIISADGIAIIRGTAGRWRPMIIRETQDEPDTVGVHRLVESLAADGWLQYGKRVDNLDKNDRWRGHSVSSRLRTWRSLLIVPSAPRSDHAATLVWWSHWSGAFEDQTDIAELFARNAGLAIHNANARDNLAQAVVARHRAGVAQGILMSRLGCTEDQAIAILKNRSQRTNRKLRLIADEIIRIGDLEPAPNQKERDRISVREFETVD